MADRLRRVLAPVVLSMLLFALACTPQPSSSVSGAIIDLQAASLTQVRSFSLRDAEGKTWSFTAAQNATDEQGRPLNASHLREHMTIGEQVMVEFRREADALIAERVSH